MYMLFYSTLSLLGLLLLCDIMMAYPIHVGSTVTDNKTVIDGKDNVEPIYEVVITGF